MKISSEQFRHWNTITGWVSFLIAVFVYLSTIEPTASFWDCGEFITSSYKLEVGHPPGAPLFLMLAKVFSLPAPSPAKVAIYINAMSAVASAFTILFLCWTITCFSKKLLTNDNEFTSGKAIAILGSGVVGSMAYAFSDSFWFSAVESEVYATSSLFTAIVFWAILKWEENFNERFTNRWIILIAYLVGLSIGVHLLNLLAIPAIVLVFYFKSNKTTLTGTIGAICISFLLLAGIQYGIINGVIQLAVWFELLFVNTLGLPYNSGVWAYSLMLILLLIAGCGISFYRKKIVLNTIFLTLTMILLGYSSYSMIVIRSMANPPLNENRPDNALSLLSYLNRDQYGDRPLLYGPYFNAPILETKDGKPEYVREKGKYVVSYRKPNYVYDSRFNTIFPRMYSRETSHISVYKNWTNFKGTPLAVTKDNVEIMVNKPTFLENISFFVKYQVGYMYFRYFMWNFAGRQNNIDGNGGIIYGNWSSGINFIDNLFFGPQNKLPQYLKQNKGHNTYYFLPLLLGLAGFCYQLKKNKKDFLVVFLLFFMTGIAIVIYLNQTPLQPRERDYAYVGSFYAFAIWIGIGTLALIDLIKRWVSYKSAAITGICLTLMAVPLLMAFQNYDDHNRSERYTTRDVAYNYLNSCAPNAILFTSGDNDTFPLWYLQEVEGIRTDVRVVNLTLLSCDWYIDQQKQRINIADPLPIALESEKVRDGKRDFVYIIEKASPPITLKEAIAFVGSDSANTKYELSKNEYLDYLPTRNLTLPVDTQLVKLNKTVLPDLPDKIVPQLLIKINKNYLTKSELMVMDILATNKWKRPVYFTTANHDGTLGLDNYLQLEGFAYRLVPVQSKSQGFLSAGRVETSIMYDNLMYKFHWGRMNEPGVLIDDQNIQTQRILHTRINFSRLAEQLFQEGKKDSARKVLYRCIELMPSKVFPPDMQSYKLEETAFIIGERETGRKLLEEHAAKSFEELNYFFGMNAWQMNLSSYERSLSELAVCRLADIAEKTGQPDLKKEYKKRFKEITGMELSKFGN